MLICATSAFGQGWYAGATAGYGFAPTVTITGPSGSANAGFDNGYAAGAFFGNDTYARWGGEVRYLFRQDDLKLESNSASTHFAAHSNILTGDLLWHLRPREATIRPFAEFGGGMRFVDGTGPESASQPLGRFAGLTHTTQTLPVADLAVGVKANFHTSWQLRIEVHDYVGPSPNKVIAPAPGATMSSWLNDIVGTVSIAYHW